MRRNLSALLLSGIAAFALSGCIKLDMDMKVRADTKVDGTMVVAFSEETMKMFESMGAGMVDKNAKTPTTKQKSFEQQTKDGVKETQAKLPKGSSVKLYKKDGWIGQEIKFSAVDPGVALNAGTSAGASGGEMPGPKPILFFAPDHAVATIQELGPKGFGEAVGRSWKSFLAAAEGVVDIQTHAGLGAAAKAFLDTLEGRMDPQKGIIIQP